MELWIRSQDRTKLFKVDSVAYMDMSEDMNIEVHSIWNVNGGILGTYRTKERALEILNEIQNRLNIRHSSGASAEFIVLSEIVPRIYEMPEE